VCEWRSRAVVLWPVESNVVFQSLDDSGGALLCLLYGEHFYSNFTESIFVAVY
jgi:hypothetical protein